jgi:hypothetical protein
MIGRGILLLKWYNNLQNILEKLLMEKEFKKSHLKYFKQNNVNNKIFVSEKKKKTAINNY